MKTLLTILLFIIPFIVLSQEVIEKSFDVKKDTKIDLNLRFADDIVITKSTDDKMHFKTTYNINNGDLNEAFEIDIDADENEVDIDTDLDESVLKRARKAHNDDDCDSSYSSDCYKVCADINFEIQIPDDVELELETIDGNIELVGIVGKLDIKSISGFIDLSWGNTGANMELKTITGEIYSDLKLKNLNTYNMSYVGSDIDAEYNGGGLAVKLETISSDIFLRKE